MAKRLAANGGEGKVICKNRRASHEYTIGDRLEAGIVLTGTEVKSCREGKAHLNDAYVRVERGEAYLVNAHIAEYTFGNRFNHEPTRMRKLLLNRREIHKLDIRLRERGYAAIPLSLYFNADGRVKVEVGVGTGKTQVDRRHDIKDREIKRELERVARRRRGPA